MSDVGGGPAALSNRVRAEVVAFLRNWLPESAKAEYREMMRRDPVNWSRHPHFAGGIIVEHALRGNGITERVLGIPDLNVIWPDLLREAVATERGDAASA